MAYGHHNNRGIPHRDRLPVEEKRRRRRAAQKRYDDKHRNDPLRIARARKYMLTYNRKLQLRRYNMTSEDYDSLLRSQHGACAICGIENPGRGRIHFCVDHNKTTGKIRGLLCFNCNAHRVASNTLGDIGDVIEYLKRTDT